MKLEEAIKSSNFASEKHKATLNVLYSAYWLKTQLSSALKDMGLTTEQFNVMRILKGKHPEKMCVKDIGNRMIEQNSNVPRIIDRLLIKNLVKRVTSPTDKRETLISLSDVGLKQLEAANQVLNTVTDKVIDLSEADAALLNAILENMRVSDELLVKQNKSNKKNKQL